MEDNNPSFLQNEILLAPLYAYGVLHFPGGAVRLNSV